MIVHCPTQRGPKPVPQAKPGDIRLRAGDILLLDTGSSFAQQHRQSKYFSIVLEMENTNPVSRLGQQLRTIIVAAVGTRRAQPSSGWVAGRAGGWWGKQLVRKQLEHPPRLCCKATGGRSQGPAALLAEVNLLVNLLSCHPRCLYPLLQPRYLHTFIAIASITTAFILYALEILDILPGKPNSLLILLLF